MAVMAMLSFLSLQGFAQGTGYIIRPAGTTNLGSGGTTGAFLSATSVTGKDILNPNGDNYTSSAQNVWSAGDDVTGSELPYAAIPPYSSEPYSDLRRGAGHLYSDFVPSGRTSDLGASYYMYYRSNLNTEALCFRLRMGSMIPGSKGYSILIDADGKFGATGPNADPNYVAATTGVNGNSGFELEVDLFTQTSGQTGIALYNVDGTSSPALVWNANDYTQFSQVSIAGTNDNGDPDFYLDFFIPWNKITGIGSLGITAASTLRFIPTTVMSPLPAIGGPKSDIYGLNDGAYTDPNVEYETLLSAMPGFSINQLSGTTAGAIPGTGNTQLCTAAPVIASATSGTGTASVTGTWTNLSISAVNSATIYLYKNGSSTSFATTTASGGSWTANNLTIASGDIITAKAQGSGENMCLTSNSIKAAACSNSTWVAANLVAPIGGTTTQSNCLNSGTTSKGVDGVNRTSALWTVYVNESFANTTQNSTNNQGSAGFVNGSSTTTFTASSTPDWKYSSGCSGGSNMGAGIYTFWYQDANGCKSEVTPLCVTGTGNSSSQVGGTVNVTPTVAPATITSSTTSVTVTGAAGSHISLYYDGEVIVSGTIPGTYNSTTPTSGSITFSNLLFQSSGVVSAMSQVIGATINTSYCIAKSASQIIATCITPAPVISTYFIGKAIGGTGVPGSTIKLYQTNTSGTLLATVTVGTNGAWTTGVNATASTTYVATAQSSTCSVSASSTSVTTSAGITTGRCGSITTTGITAATTTIQGTLISSATSTTVNLYEDGYLVGSQSGITNSSSWSVTVPNLYAGNGINTGKLTIGIQESGKEEQVCDTSVVKAFVNCSKPASASLTLTSCTKCTNNDPSTLQSGGTITYQVGDITNPAIIGNFYSLRNQATGQSLSSGIWASSTSFPITTNALSTAGTYTIELVGSSVSSTEVCSNTGVAARSYTVLPITLLEFKGARAGNTNVLGWKTAREINASRFEVERSTDGITYNAIGTVPASGTATEYSFTDNQPQPVSYYRLKLVDIDRQFKYSKVILLRENGSSIVLNAVRPNPFTSDVTVSLYLAQAQKVDLVVVDAAGRQVQQKNVAGAKGVNEIHLTGLTVLSKGIYVVRINCEGVLFQEKLVKID